MTHASITALALEESLSRQWTAFHTRIDGCKSPPGTREQADRTLRYASDIPFVDSIIDALSLYVAGSNEFDAVLLAYLDLTLIQRARPEDIAMLLKLAAVYAGDDEPNRLLGLLHRTRLYAERTALSELIAFCTGALQRFDAIMDNTSWARSIGMQPETDSWSLSLRFGTAPVDFWLSRRSALKPADVSLELLLGCPGQWRIQVARVDRLYSAQWRPAGITVDTDQLQLKAVSLWPSMAAQQLFPLFAIQLADFLQLQWTRTARLTVKNVTVDPSPLLQWLYPCVDEIRY